MRGLFTPEQLREINDLVMRRFRARMGLNNEPQTQMLPRRQGMAVTEGMCPHCKQELMRVAKVDNVIHYKCGPCESSFRVVDPRDEIEKMTQPTPIVPEPPQPAADPNFFETCAEIDHLVSTAEKTI